MHSSRFHFKHKSVQIGTLWPNKPRVLLIIGMLHQIASDDANVLQRYWATTFPGMRRPGPSPHHTALTSTISNLLTRMHPHNPRPCAGAGRSSHLAQGETSRGLRRVPLQVSVGQSKAGRRVACAQDVRTGSACCSLCCRLIDKAANIPGRVGPVPALLYVGLINNIPWPQV